MFAKISEGITERQASCRFFLAALKRQGPKVAERLLRNVHPHLKEGDEEPGFFATLVALGRRLRDSMKELVAFDEKLYAIKARLNTLREQREELASSLAKEIVRMRRTAMSQYQDPDLKQLGLHSPRSYRPDPLSRQASLIEEAFARDDVVKHLGEPIFEDPFDAAKTVARVLRVNGDLGSTLDEIDDKVRVYDELYIEKEEAKEKHDEFFTYTARTFEGYCRLAGFRKLADRVRPSTKRPGRIDQPDDGTSSEHGKDGSGDSEKASAQAQPDSESNAPSTVEPSSEVSVQSTDEPDPEVNAAVEAE